MKKVKYFSAIFSLFLLSAPAMASHGRIYYVNRYSYCEASTPQQSFACFEKDWGPTTEEFKLVSGDDEGCHRRSDIYCILSRTKGGKGKWDDSMGNVVGYRVKSCDLKHIKGNGRYGSHLLGFEGDAPKMQRRCENNCEVEYERAKPKEDQGSDFGTVICTNIDGEKYCASDYTALQTGAVCTPKPGEPNETTKYDEATDGPANNGDNKPGGGDDEKGKEDSGGKDNPNNPGKKPGEGKEGGKDENNGNAGGGNAGGNQGGGQGGAGEDS